MFYGKLIAGAIGYLVLGVFGLVIGLAIGHAFDRGLAGTSGFAGPGGRQDALAITSEVCFTLLGRVAKADGRVSRAEIEVAEQVMAQLGVTGSRRQEAIRHFQAGVAADFQMEPLLARFLQATRGNRLLHRTLLGVLIGVAGADGRVGAAERRVLQDCALGLGFSAAEFRRMLEMSGAQQQFHSRREAAEPSTASVLRKAHQALGVSPDVDDRKLKRAYRKLMSEHHPDKLIARGVPEEMVRLATEKSQEIQAAYDTVREHRKSARTTLH